MTAPNLPPNVFFIQLSDAAPSVSRLLKTYTARLRTSITSHDVVNGYGVGFTYHVFVEILISRCKHCAETEFTPPTFDCKWHRFEMDWMKVADGEGADLAQTLAAADRPVGEWLAERGR